jgi:hypothetical protein
MTAMFILNALKSLIIEYWSVLKIKISGPINYDQNIFSKFLIFQHLWQVQ